MYWAMESMKFEKVSVRDVILGLTKEIIQELCDPYMADEVPR